MDVLVAISRPNGNAYNEGRKESPFVPKFKFNFEHKVCSSKSFLTLSDSTVRLFQISCQQLWEITKQVWNGNNARRQRHVWYFSLLSSSGRESYQKGTSLQGKRKILLNMRTFKKARNKTSNYALICTSVQQCHSSIKHFPSKVYAWSVIFDRYFKFVSGV